MSATFYVIKTDKVNLKFLTALLNSKFVKFWLKHQGKMQGDNYQLDKEPLLKIPLIEIPQSEQRPFIEIVDKILAITKSDDYFKNLDKQTEVRELEKQIDEMVYALYGLGEGERGIIEKSS